MLIDELKKQMFQAIKAGDTVRKEILRTALGEATATGQATTDEHLLQVLRKLTKANRDTLRSVSDEQGRAVLEQEIQVLESFLPAPLSAEALVSELQSQAEALRAAPAPGPAMGVAMRHLKQAGLSAEAQDVAAAIRQIREA